MDKFLCSELNNNGGGCTADSDCDDDDACTADVCNAANVCEHAPLAYADANPCTLEYCDVATGTHYPFAQDGTACALSFAGTCQSGVCIANAAEICNDGEDNDLDGNVDLDDSECQPWINEIHYDNIGSPDSNEGVEVAGKSGFDLTGWMIILYNGATGNTYTSMTLNGTIPNEQNGYGALWFGLGADGMQNGAPDGLALVSPDGTVIKFISYEGVFTAIIGPASSLTSTDIGVAESNNTAVGYSLQLIGAGNKYSDFTWSNPMASTKGTVNTGQTFQN